MREYVIRITRNRTVQEQAEVVVTASDFQAASELASNQAEDLYLDEWRQLDCYVNTFDYEVEEA